MKTKLMKRAAASVLSAAMVLTLPAAPNLPGTAVSAASKAVKLSASKKKMKVGQSYKLKLKNNKKGWRIKKVTSTKKSVCRPTDKKKASVILKAKSKGKATIKVKVSRTVKKKVKTKVLKCKVTVTKKATAKPSAKPSAKPTKKPTAKPSAKPSTKPTAKPSTEPTAEPSAAPTGVPTSSPQAGAVTAKTQAELDSALAGAEVTAIRLDTDAESMFTIKEGDYSNIALTVDAPNAEIENSGKFKSISVLAIKDSTWTERAIGNTFTVDAPAARIIVSKEASVSGISFIKDKANVRLEVSGTVGEVLFKGADAVGQLAAAAGSLLRQFSLTPDAQRTKVAFAVEGTVTNMGLSAPSADVTVDVAKSGEVESLALASGAESAKLGLTVDGTVKATELSAPKADVKVEVKQEGKVESVALKSGAKDAKVDVAVDGSVQNVDIAAANADTKVAVASGGKVDKVALASDAASTKVGLTVDGSVESVDLAAPNAEVSVAVAEAGKVESVALASNAESAKVDMAVNGSVQNVKLDAEKAEVSVKVDGNVGSVSVSKEMSVEVSGTTTTAVPITVDATAKITASTPVTVEASKNAEVTLQANAEGSSIKLTDSNATVSVTNNTSQAVTTTTATGTTVTTPTGGNGTVTTPTGGGSSGVSGGSTGAAPTPEPTPVIYTVTFDGNAPVSGSAVSGVPSPQSVSPEKTVSEPDTKPTFADENYIFKGWYTDKDCKTIFDFTAPIAADTTVYAGWTDKACELSADGTVVANTSFAEAVKKIKEQTTAKQLTLRLFKEETITETAEIPSGNVILDLNGKTIDCNNNSSNGCAGLQINGDAALTIKGNGTVKGNENTSGLITVSGSSSVTIQDGTFQSDGNHTLLLQEKGSVTIHGGDFSGDYICRAEKAATIPDEGKNNITVDGGNFNVTTFGIVAFGNSRIQISNGTFTSNASQDTTAVYCLASATEKETPENKITISGGTFKTVRGLVLNGKGHADVTGGTFDYGEKGYSLEAYNQQNVGNDANEDSLQEKRDCTINVTGGTFNGHYGMQLLGLVEATVSGGEFNCSGIGISSNASDPSKNANWKLTVEEGTKITSEDTAIYMPSKGDVIINGGTLVGESVGIAIRSGTLKVNGGKIICHGERVDEVSQNGGTGNVNGAIVLAQPNSGYIGKIDVFVESPDLIQTDSNANGEKYDSIVVDEETATGNGTIDWKVSTKSGKTLPLTRIMKKDNAQSETTTGQEQTTTFKHYYDGPNLITSYILTNSGGSFTSTLVPSPSPSVASE